MAVAKSFTRLSAVVRESWERRGVSRSGPTCRVREYSAQNWSTERIRTSDAEEVGGGSGA